jgi:hypothetical protein
MVLVVPGGALSIGARRGGALYTMTPPSAVGPLSTSEIVKKIMTQES